MKTLEEIRNTPVLLLTDEEIAQLDPNSQKWARQWRAQRTREDGCVGHEAVSTSTWEEQRRGWHKMHCKHCGRDMSIDSGD